MLTSAAVCNAELMSQDYLYIFLYKVFKSYNRKSCFLIIGPNIFCNIVCFYCSNSENCTYWKHTM